MSASTHPVQATGIRGTEASAPRPPAVGYARLAATAVAERGRVRRQLAAFAASRGFTPRHVFVEPDDTATSAFAALTEALRNGRARTVIVPYLRRFARMTQLELAMKELLERGAGASVLIINAEPAASAATTKMGQQCKPCREHR